MKKRWVREAVLALTIWNKVGKGPASGKVIVPFKKALDYEYSIHEGGVRAVEFVCCNLG